MCVRPKLGPELYYSHIAPYLMTLRLSCVNSMKCKCVSGGRSRSKTPAPLKGLEGCLEFEEHEWGLESRGFLGYDGSFALLSGKSTVVNFWV